MTKKVTVVDSGTANLASMLNALRFLGLDADVASRGGDLDSASQVILPGVGAYGAAMDHLDRTGLSDGIRAVANRGGFILGVCLGMQLLGSVGTEFGEHQGLNLVAARAEAINRPGLPAIPIPNVGWLDISREPGFDPLFEFSTQNAAFYFTHSYELVLLDHSLQTSRVEVGGRSITASFAKDRVMGVQFHPEKSGRDGLSLLRSFADLA